MMKVIRKDNSTNTAHPKNTRWMGDYRVKGKVLMKHRSFASSQVVVKKNELVAQEVW